MLTGGAAGAPAGARLIWKGLELGGRGCVAADPVLCELPVRAAA